MSSNLIPSKDGYENETPGEDQDSDDIDPILELVENIVSIAPEAKINIVIHCSTDEKKKSGMFPDNETLAFGGGAGSGGGSFDGAVILE